MDIEKIMERFRLLSGMTEAEAESCRSFCTNAAEYIGRLLVSEESSEESCVVTAAAAHAYYYYCLSEDSRHSESFTLGDLSTSATSRTGAARELLSEAMVDCGALIRSADFAFIVV